MSNSTPRRLPVEVRAIFMVARWLVVAYLLVIILFSYFEESLIFAPTAYADGDWQPTGLQFEDAWFTAADGTKLHGWYLPVENPRAVLLYAHGNGGNLSYRAESLRAFQNQLQTTVLIFDYRGYGRSSGRPSEQGVLADARAARAWLAQRAGIPANQIVLLGESLGGGVACDLAATDGARGLILESTFASLPDAAAVHYPWLPTRTLMHTRLDSFGKIGRFQGPLLMVHGEADTVIPLGQAKRLFEQANEPKQFVLVLGGGHNVAGDPGYLRALDSFLKKLP